MWGKTLSAQLISSLILLAFSCSSEAAHLHKEKEYQEAWCREASGIAEYVLDDGARVDCLADEYAIEFDFAPKWAEAVGQALYYAIKTDRKPGIVLIFEEDGQDRYLKRLQQLALQYRIKVWTMSPEEPALTK